MLKDDKHVATAATPDGTVVTVPALQVEVLDPIGAGDAFAAGYLAADLAGLSMEQRLRLGHLNAACVLAVAGDHASPPDTEVREALLTCGADDWARTQVTPSGISSPALHTPWRAT